MKVVCLILFFSQVWSCFYNPAILDSFLEKKAKPLHGSFLPRENESLKKEQEEAVMLIGGKKNIFY